VTDKLEQNKANAKAFYDLMFNQCKVREAFEHWDVLQVVPAESKHDNGMF
jgi:predicted SnoaL-like aldol condensation-catalyzing enzyme